jgi:hypothetical protein
MAQDAFALVSKWASGRATWSITGLSVSASNFVSLEKDSGDVAEMFKNARSDARNKDSTVAVNHSRSATVTPAASPIKADQIDASVLAELPEEIQREIRASMGMSTGGAAAKRKPQANSITNYFSKKSAR